MIKIMSMSIIIHTKLGYKKLQLESDVSCDPGLWHYYLF